MDALDFFSFMIILLVFAVVSIFLFPTFSSLFSTFENEPTFYTPAKEVSTNFKQTANTTGDFVFLAFFIGCVIGIFVSILLVPYHPIFIGVSIIMLLLALYLSPYIVNIFANVFNQLPSETQARFPMMEFIFQNLPLISLGIFVLFLIFAYTKIGG